MNTVIYSVRFQGKRYDFFLPQVAGDHVEFYGYTIYQDGRILSPRGQLLKRISLSGRDSHVSINISGVKAKVNVSKLVYSAFARETLPKNVILTYKDGDETNKAFDNLKKIPKRDYYSKIEKKKKKMFTPEVVDEIRNKYIPRNKDNYNDKNLPSYRSLAKEYGCSVFVIQKIMKGDYL